MVLRYHRWICIFIFCCLFFLVPAFGAEKEEEETYRIEISCADNLVAVYQEEESGETLQKVFSCSVGPDTPGGTFYTSEKYLWRFLFGDVYGQYATRITGNILFHSVPYYEEDPSTLEYEEYNKLGTPASMGCIRLRVCDAKWIYDHCAIGTEVTIQAEPFETPLPQPERTVLDVSDKERRGWDPTDPNPENPWRSDVFFLDGVAVTKQTTTIQVDGREEEVELWHYQGRNYGSWEALQSLFSTAMAPSVSSNGQVMRFLFSEADDTKEDKTDVMERWSLVCGKKAISSDVIWLDGVPYFSLGDLASLFDVPLVWSEEEGYCISSRYPIFASTLLWTQTPFSSQKESGFFLVQGKNE